MSSVSIPTGEEQSPLQEIIHKLYIEPIKSVVFVDDEFPTYESLLTSSLTSQGEDEVIDLGDLEEDKALAKAIGARKGVESPEQGGEEVADFGGISEGDASTPVTAKGKELEESILQLVRDCIERGYTPYVENRYRTAQAIFKNADLVILDYKLDPENHNNARPCLDILKDLNGSPKLSLVAIYTNDAPQEVARDVTISLRGGGRCGVTPRSMRGMVEAQLMEFLGDYVRGNDIRLEAEASFSRVIVDNFKGALEDLARRRYVGLRSEAPPEDLNKNILSGETENAIPWIRGKNVFLIILSKNRNDGIDLNYFINQMTIALSKHGPKPLAMVAQASINALVQQTPDIVENIFGDSLTNAAILFHTLTGFYPTQGSGDRHLNLRSRELVQSIMLSIAASVHENTSRDVDRIFSGILTPEMRACMNSGNLPQNIVQQFYNLAQKYENHQCSEEHELYFALNAFLCSEDHVADHLTTGTIFKADKRYWVCTSPACDLVPRDRMSSCLRGSIAPSNYFVACRLDKISNAQKRIDALHDAEQGRHIFIKKDQLILRFLNEGTNQPSPYIFYMLNGCYIPENKKFEIYRAKKGKMEVEPPYFHKINSEIITQLRPTYSARLLQQTGLHNSRIGVDFRKIPKISECS